MMQLQAKTYASGAEMVAHYNAIGKLLRMPERRPRLVVVLAPPAEERVEPRPDASAHVEAWTAWRLVQASRHDPEAYVKARCTQLGIGFVEMRSGTRRMAITGRRQELMFEVCWLFPSLSFPKIGRIFNKDHTTVIHALTKVCAARGLDISLFYQAKANAHDQRIEEARSLYFAGETYASITKATGFASITISRMVKAYNWKAAALKARVAGI
ncbi:hypothetical protein G6L07_08345 [Agrobacterium rhizogenes]|nr:hypothetical protein [Rhizobium rhizogenes]